MRYVALLRGVNVGGHKKVQMVALRRLLEGLGFTAVATLLQSGNAVFTAPSTTTAELERRIEAALAKSLGFDVEVLVRTRDELAATIADNPLPGADDEPAKSIVSFCSAVPDPARVRAIDAAAYHPDEFRVVGRAIYARFPGGMGRSRLATVLGGPRLGVTSTARNWTTVRKLLELADGQGRSPRTPAS